MRLSALETRFRDGVLAGDESVLAARPRVRPVVITPPRQMNPSCRALNRKATSKLFHHLSFFLN